MNDQFYTAREIHDEIFYKIDLFISPNSFEIFNLVNVFVCVQDNQSMFSFADFVTVAKLKKKEKQQKLLKPMH